MALKSDTILQGMKEICAYVNRSESTVINWILNQEFPASKLGGLIWESDKVSIDEWKRKRIINENGKGKSKKGKR